MRARLGEDRTRNGPRPCDGWAIRASRSPRTSRRSTTAPRGWPRSLRGLGRAATARRSRSGRGASPTCTRGASSRASAPSWPVSSGRLGAVWSAAVRAARVGPRCSGRARRLDAMSPLKVLGARATPSRRATTAAPCARPRDVAPGRRDSRARSRRAGRRARDRAWSRRGAEGMRPRRFAVVGDPVAHSKSPAMHAAAYRALGLPHTYEAMRAAPEELARVVAMLREGAVRRPQRDRAAQAARPRARRRRRPGRPARGRGQHAGPGRRRSHRRPQHRRARAGGRAPPAGRHPAPRWEAARALVLGSGGAARAAIAALATHLGVRDVVVRARSFDDATRREAFVVGAPGPVSAQPWDPSPQSEGADARGRAGHERGHDRRRRPGEGVAGVVAWEALPAERRRDRRRLRPAGTLPGCAPPGRGAFARDDGLGMLARQGALAFELWLGVPAPLDAMRRAIE